MCKYVARSLRDFREHVQQCNLVGTIKKETVPPSNLSNDDKLYDEYYHNFSDDYDDDSEDDNDVTINAKGQRVFTKDYWRNVHMRTVDKLPYNINGLSAYSLQVGTRMALLEKCRDGRPWKHDSRSKWCDYDSVRYKDCSGGFVCPNLDCPILQEFGFQNNLKFDKMKSCTTCGAIGNPVDCPARKYIATNGNEAHIYHYGEHMCGCKTNEERPTDIVSDSLRIDLKMKPSSVQGNAVLAAMRNRKSWEEITKTVKKVTNKKAISNEKIKQRQKLQPLGTGFSAVEEYKKFTDEKDKCYVYAIDKHRQFVFKTSQTKMKIAYSMDNTGNHFLSEEYCYFDGKVKRTKDFTTLTASVYHPLLQKQVPLAIMECKSEDGTNIGLFWQEFNRAYKEVNECEKKFNPTGWVSDMATANFNGLVHIYGEDVLTKIKGFEFHYKQSINRHANTLVDEIEKFKGLANDML